ANLADVATLVLELKDGGARHNLELRYLGQHVQQLFGHPVREIILLSLAAHVCEWQHGDGVAFSERRCCHIAFAERWLTVEIPAQREHDQQPGRSEETPAARAIGSDLYAFWCEIKHPCHHHRNWKTQQSDQDKNAQRPRWGIERGEADRRRLHREPRHDEISCADFKYPAPLQLCEEVTW